MEKSEKVGLLKYTNKTPPEINRLIGKQLEDPNASETDKISFESCSFDHTVKNLSTNISKDTSIFAIYKRVSFDKCTFSASFKHLDTLESTHLEELELKTCHLPLNAL